MSHAVGQVWYSSSSHSPISVSSLSSLSSSAASSPHFQATGRKARSAGNVSSVSVHHPHASLLSSGDKPSPPRALNATTEQDDASFAWPRALVYVTPTTVQQCSTLSGVDSLCSTYGDSLVKRLSSLSVSTEKRNTAEAESGAQRETQGGYWHLAYVVASFPIVANKEPSSSKEKASHTLWCFTLQPLPAEQWEACQATLNKYFEQPKELATPSRTPQQSFATDCKQYAPSHLTRKDMPQLLDLLVTPLYLCVDSEAFVEVEPFSSASSLLSDGRDCVPAVESENAETRADRLMDGTWHAFLRGAPSCAALVYALRQQFQRGSPLLSLLSDDAAGHADMATTPTMTDWGGDEDVPSESRGADVYLTLAPLDATTPQHARSWRSTDGASPLYTKKGGGTATDPWGSPRVPWSPLTSSVLRRCSHTQHQAVLFEGCGVAALCGYRRGLLNTWQHASTSALQKLQAALCLLDMLRPRCDSTGTQCHGEARVTANITDTLDVYFQSNASPLQVKLPEPQMGCSSRVSPSLSVVGGRVRRLLSLPEGAEGSSGVSEPAPSANIVPEPEWVRFLWTHLHRENMSQPTDVNAVDGLPLGTAPSQPLAHNGASWEHMKDCMQQLEFAEELQAFLHDTTRAMLHLASLEFVPRQGTRGHTTSAAEIAATSLASCEAAAHLLRVSPEELQQALTAVHVRASHGATGRVSTVCHALNMSGAGQMRSVLLAHLGGVLVHTLLRAINVSLRPHANFSPGVTLAGEPDALTRVLSLVVVATHRSESDETKASKWEESAEDIDAHAEPTQGGLQDWYAAYTRYRIHQTLLNRLVSHLQQEAVYEGAEREVVSWLDQLVPTTSCSSFSTASAGTLREAARLAQRVQPPTHASFAFSSTEASSAAEGTVVREFAEALNSVSHQCTRTELESCPTSMEAVRLLLVAALDGFVQEEEEDDIDMSSEGRRKKTSAATSEGNATRMSAEGEVTWRRSTKAAAGEHHGTPRECILIAFPGNVCPPLSLSLTRLANDIFASVRLCKMGMTPAVRHVMRSRMAVSAAVLPSCARDDLKTSETAPRVLDKQNGSSAFATERLLEEILSLPSTAADAGAVAFHGENARASLSPVFLHVVHAIPITPKEADEVHHVQAVPFLLPMVLGSTPTTSPRGDSAAHTRTLDDKLTSYVQRGQPLWVSLFLWSWACHSRVWPVPRFAKSWAVPLLTAHALRATASSTLQNSSTPRQQQFSPLSLRTDYNGSSSTSSPAAHRHGLSHVGREDCHLRFGCATEEARALLERVRHLQKHARFRELAHVALKVLPACRDAVLGVSHVFLTEKTATEMRKLRSQLCDAATDCLQAAGRGYQARVRLARQLATFRGTAHEATTATSDSAADQERTRNVFSPAELTQRAALEQRRDDVLRDTAAAGTAALRASTEHLQRNVAALQHGWTRSLTLMESELTRAVTQMNTFEVQRLAAEDAARQEARTVARATAEAWADAWSETQKRREHRAMVQKKERERQQRRHASVAPQDAVEAARVEEELRLEVIKQRHMERVRRAATQSAEAALLTRAVASTQQQQARWLRQHVRRQERRLTREAQLREKNKHVGEAGPLQNGVLHGGERLPLVGTTAHSPVQKAQAWEYSNADGLVFSRPRPASRRARARGTVSAARHVSHSRNTSVNVSLRDETSRSVASIDRTAAHDATRDVSESDCEWEVQRDLMALWESSRVTP